MDEKIFYTNSINMTASEEDIQLEMLLLVNNLVEDKSTTVIKDKVTAILSVSHAKRLYSALGDLLKKFESAANTKQG